VDRVPGRSEALISGVDCGVALAPHARQFQSPEADRARQRLGVSADIQMPGSITTARLLEKVFGEPGMCYFFPLRLNLDAGVIIAAAATNDRDDKNGRRILIIVSEYVDRGGEEDHAGPVVHAKSASRGRGAAHAYDGGGLSAVPRRHARSLEVGKLADLV